MTGFLGGGAAASFSYATYFSHDFYLEENADVREAGVDPLAHYLKHGWRERRDPNWLFSVDGYLKAHPDVAAAGIEPLQHYATRGWREGWRPHPAFSPLEYLSDHPDVAAAGMEPLAHFLRHGAREGRPPCRSFDVAFYLTANPDVARSGIPAIEHFVRYGSSQGLWPNATDDPLWLATLGPLVSDPFLAWVARRARPHGPRRNGSIVFPPDFNDPLPALVATRPDPAAALRAAEEVRRLVTDADVLSLDVWDTLLRRDCHPDEIKLQSARFVLLEAGERLRPAFVDRAALFHARLAAEGAVARADHEFRLLDAIPIWLRSTMLADVTEDDVSALADRVMDHEQQAEHAAISADPLGQTLAAMPTTAIRVFSSDFYVGKPFIQRLLERAGLGRLCTRGYVSCDTFETKRSGALFRRIAEELGVQHERILHVGDNPHADVAAPTALGLRTVHYVDRAQEERRAASAGLLEAALRGDHSVVTARQAALAEAPPGADALAMLGYRIAPVVLGLALAAMETSVRNRSDRVLFCAREGLFFAEAYAAVAEENPYCLARPPKAEILYFSRRSTFAASLESVDTTSLMRLWRMYSRQSVSALAATLNLDQAAVAQIAFAHGIDPEVPLDRPWQDPSMRALLADPVFAALAGEACRRQRQGVLKHLARASVNPDSPMTFVDIGWRGTIQDNLARLRHGPIEGVYLGLFRFLNPQPEVGSKHGVFFDENLGRPLGATDRPAAIEAMFNAPGGSVVGHDEDGVPIRQTDAAEEAFVAATSRPVQAAILAQLPRLARETRARGWHAADWVPHGAALLRGFIERPPSAFADRFSQLSHDETFGTGRVHAVGQDIDALRLLPGGDPAQVHAHLRSALHRAAWPAGLARSTAMTEFVAALDADTRSHVPAQITALGAPARILARGCRAIVLAPGPIRGSGGHKTLFAFARRLSELGFDTAVHLESRGDGIAVAEAMRGEARVSLHRGWEAAGAADLAVATLAASAAPVARSDAWRKAYLIQDFEAGFNPLGDGYVIGENSYAAGLAPLTVGRWLPHVLLDRYGVGARWGGLGVATETYGPPDPAVPRERAVCFLFQPDKPRRTPALGLEALRRLKATRPDVTVYTYGSPTPPPAGFEFIHLGLIDDVRELAALYRRCLVGLCVSMSNPSRIPFEMLACGCIPVDLYRYNNLFDHDGRGAVLAHQSAASLATALMGLVDAPEDTAARGASAAEAMRAHTMEWELDALMNGVLELLGSGTLAPRYVGPRYAADPVISDEEREPSVLAYLAWQRRLAGAGNPIAQRTDESVRRPA